jgi:hypothetical protein
LRHGIEVEWTQTVGALPLSLLLHPSSDLQLGLDDSLVCDLRMAS